MNKYKVTHADSRGDTNVVIVEADYVSPSEVPAGIYLMRNAVQAEPDRDQAFQPGGIVAWFNYPAVISVEQVFENEDPPVRQLHAVSNGNRTWRATPTEIYDADEGQLLDLSYYAGLAPGVDHEVQSLVSVMVDQHNTYPHVPWALDEMNQLMAGSLCLIDLGERYRRYDVPSDIQLSFRTAIEQAIAQHNG